MGEQNGVVRQKRRRQQPLFPIHDNEDEDVDEAGDDNDDEPVPNYDTGDEDDRGPPSQRGSNYTDESRGTCHKAFVFRVGEKFASRRVHTSISNILRENLDKPWITYRQVPKEVRDKMFKKFKTRYALDPEAEESNREAFINVQKKVYKDIMVQFKKKAAERAVAAGYVDVDYRRVDITCNYCPDKISESVWRGLCKKWDTEEWRMKSENGKKNRASANNGDKPSRHTGGSIGYDEHRIRLTKVLRREPTFREVFLYTHLNKESKVKLLAGELNINTSDGMVFVTQRSRTIYEAYLEEMIKMHGPDFKIDDPDVWTRAQGGSTTRVFGIGSSDINFVVTGKPTSSYGIGPSFTEYIEAQEKIQNLESRLESERQRMEGLLEAERRERVESQQQMEDSLTRKFEEFTRNLKLPGNQ